MNGINSQENKSDIESQRELVCREIEIKSPQDAKHQRKYDEHHLKNPLLGEVLDSIEDIICIQKPDHTILWFNRAGYEALGKRPEEIAGKKCFELMGRQKSCDGCTASLAMASMQISAAEKYVPELGRYFQCTCNPLIDKDGNIYLIIELLHDITGRKKAEEALRESKESLNVIFETSLAGIFLVNADGIITFANQHMADLFVCSIEDLFSTAYVDLLHPDIRAVGLANMKSLMAGEIDNVSVERRYLRRNGQVFWGHLSGRRHLNADGKFQGLVGIITDITERKQSEEALRESEARFKSIYRSTPIGIEIYGPDGRLIHVNKACMDIFGILDIKDVYGFDLFDDPNLPKDAKEFLLQGETIRYETAFNFEKIKDLGLYKTLKSGIIYIYVIISPLFLEGSMSPSNYLVQVQDITERKESEKSLTASESKFSAAFQISPNPLAITDIISSKIIEINRAYEEGTGFSREELIGHSALEMNIWVDPLERDNILRMLNSGEEVQDQAVKLRRKDGTIRDMLFSARLITVADNCYLLSQAHDITERNKAAVELSRSEERLRLALEAARMTCWEWDILEDKVFCRGELQGLVGHLQGCALNPGNYWFQKLIHLEDRHKVNSAIEMAIEKCDEYDIVFRIVLPKGDVRWIASKGRVFSDHSGKAARMMGIDVDITDSKLAELAILGKENQQRALLDNIPDMAWLKDAQSRFIAVNEPFARACGREPEDLIGKSDLDIWPKDLAEGYRADDIDVMARRKRKAVEEPLADVEGKKHWKETIKTPIFNDEDQVIGTVGISRDITERKFVEEELRQSEAKYLDLYNNAPNAYFSIGADGKIAMCNVRAGELLGYPYQSLIGKSFLDLFAETPSGRERAESVFHDFLICKPTNDIELQMLKGDGSPIWVSLTVNAVKDDQERIIESRSMVMDITERKKTEEALKEYQNRMGEIIDFLPDATFVIDREGKVIAWNKAIEKMTGLMAEEMIGAGDYEYGIPFYGKRRPILIDLVLKPCLEVERDYTNISRLDDGTLTGEAYIPNLRGGGIYLQGNAAALYNSRGEIVGAIESIRDVTGRKHSEDALKISEAKYRAIVEDMPNALCRYKPDGTLTYVNEEYCNFIGKSEDELMGNSFLPLIPEDAQKKIKENLATLSVIKPVATHEMQTITQSGDVRWYLWTNRALFNDQGSVLEYQSIGEDITDEINAREALIRAKDAAESAARAKSEFL
ncbi:MAG: PAS domain S-box protein, partial [Methanothrix sp.]|nr:PAS domain S-box protein [Methanothrix sp.]